MEYVIFLVKICTFTIHHYYINWRNYNVFFRYKTPAYNSFMMNLTYSDVVM